MILSLALSLPSTAAPKKKRKHPDLVITQLQIKQLPGNPPYVLEDESGHTPGFVVDVRVQNIGHARAGRSVVQLDIETTGGEHVRALSKQVRPLDPTEFSGKRFNVDLDFNGPPPLGLLRVRAIADQRDSVDEGKANEKNNVRHAKNLLPVVAHSWKSVDFETFDTLSQGGFPGSLMTDTTQTCPPSDCGDQPFIFRFSTYNEAAQQFEYVPSGTLTAGWHFSWDGGGQHCTGDAHETRGPKDWPGGFWLNGKLDSYEGSVNVSDEAPPSLGEIYCNGNPIMPVQWALQDLETYIGDGLTPRMPSSDCTRLTGHHEKTQVSGAVTTWQWQFQAVVPKQSC
jgi:hypothetical protein